MSMRARAWIWSNDEKNRRHSPHRDRHFKWHRRQTTLSSDPAWSAIVELWQKQRRAAERKAINRPRQSANRRTKKCHYLELKLMHEKKTRRRRKNSHSSHTVTSLKLPCFSTFTLPVETATTTTAQKVGGGWIFQIFLTLFSPRGISCENLNSTSSHFSSCSACAWENEFYFILFFASTSRRSPFGGYVTRTTTSVSGTEFSLAWKHVKMSII